MSNRWQRAGGGSYNPAAPKPARRFGAPGAAQREYQASEEQRNRAAYIASAKAKSQKTRGYFDDSDDDEDDELLRETNAGDDGDDDVDPLDAFMAQNDAQVKAPAPKRPRPERLDESARDAVDDAAAEAVARERAAAAKPVEDARPATTAATTRARRARRAGRDVLALAETGSGKTLAYGWPLLAHCARQRPSEAGEGPLGLVLCPTRELCEQIYRELFRFSRHARRREPLGVVAVFGGSGKYEMGKALQRRGADVAVATPGRLIELVADGTTELQSRCSFLVVDEADRMFELGFAEQLKGLAQHVRPQRQCAFTTATLPPKLDGLVRGALRDPVRVVVGKSGASFAANDSVLQRAHVLPRAADKFPWLASRLPIFLGADNKIVVFCGMRKHVDELAGNLKRQFPAYLVAGLHGDKDQGERAAVLAKFKKHATSGAVLVATDVAARGLDVENVTCVVNFDTPTSIEQYVHRVGRTGRRSRTSEEANRGEAHTLLDRTSTDDESFARMLVRRSGAPATKR
ncbi:DEAD box polypeptide 42 [Aureococcus anophagefferens]|nr:DEAD box polypeptide 42 [Aureococcus anophagefferens]